MDSFLFYSFEDAVALLLALLLARLQLWNSHPSLSYPALLWFSLCIFCLGFIEWFVNLWNEFSSNLVNFWSLPLQRFFSVPFSSYGTSTTHTLNCLIVSPRFRCCTLFSVFFLCLLPWGFYIVLCPEVHLSFVLICLILVKPIQWVFISYSVYIISRISIWFFWGIYFYYIHVVL